MVKVPGRKAPRLRSGTGLLAQHNDLGSARSTAAVAERRQGRYPSEAVAGARAKQWPVPERSRGPVRSGNHQIHPVNFLGVCILNDNIKNSNTSKKQYEILTATTHRLCRESSPFSQPHRGEMSLAKMNPLCSKKPRRGDT
jgi:hypothetical protein